MSITLFKSSTGEQLPVEGTAQLQEMLESGEATTQDYVFYPGAEDWVPIGQISFAGGELVRVSQHGEGPKHEIPVNQETNSDAIAGCWFIAIGDRFVPFEIQETYKKDKTTLLGADYPALALIVAANPLSKQFSWFNTPVLVAARALDRGDAEASNDLANECIIAGWPVVLGKTVHVSDEILESHSTLHSLLGAIKKTNIDTSILTISTESGERICFADALINAAGTAEENR